MRLTITVKPNSKRGPLVEQQPDGSLIVYLREIPADGQANEALVKLLATHYRIPKTSVEIMRGHTSRHKVVELPAT